MALTIAVVWSVPDVIRTGTQLWLGVEGSRTLISYTHRDPQHPGNAPRPPQ